MPTSIHSVPESDYEIRYNHLFHEGRALSFPCDQRGRVDLDSLAPRARSNYFYARAMTGREFATPAVLARELH